MEHIFQNITIADAHHYARQYPDNIDLALAELKNQKKQHNLSREKFFYCIAQLFPGNLTRYQNFCAYDEETLQNLLGERYHQPISCHCLDFNELGAAALCDYVTKDWIPNITSLHLVTGNSIAQLNSWLSRWFRSTFDKLKTQMYSDLNAVKPLLPRKTYETQRTPRYEDIFRTFPKPSPEVPHSLSAIHIASITPPLTQIHTAQLLNMKIDALDRHLSRFIFNGEPLSYERLINIDANELEHFYGARFYYVAWAPPLIPLEERTLAYLHDRICKSSTLTKAANSLGVTKNELFDCLVALKASYDLLKTLHAQDLQEVCRLCSIDGFPVDLTTTTVAQAIEHQLSIVDVLTQYDEETVLIQELFQDDPLAETQKRSSLLVHFSVMGPSAKRIRRGENEGEFSQSEPSTVLR